MKDIWKKLINIGVHEHLPVSEVKYVVLINALTVIGCLLSFTLLPFLIYHLPTTKLLLYSILASSVVFSIALPLNLSHNYLAARIYINVATTSFVAFLTILVGPEINARYYLIIVIAIAFFAFPPRERLYQYLVILYAALAYLGPEIWFAFHEAITPLPPELIKIAKINGQATLLLFTLAFFFYASSNYQRAEANLAKEKEKSESLLHNILPRSIADRLRSSPDTIADGFDNTTILFSDIVGFTTLSQQIPPAQLVAVLNQIFSMFDELVDKHGLEKIKTIGDAYMVVGGLPVPRDDHAEAVADMALEMQQKLTQFNQKHDQTFEIRTGIHSGVTVAGVIGIKKFIYDVWGDTVNTASRMESHGIPGQIQVSEETYQLLKENYLLEDRGLIEVKGKGAMRTYLLQGKNKQLS